MDGSGIDCGTEQREPGTSRKIRQAEQQLWSRFFDWINACMNPKKIPKVQSRKKTGGFGRKGGHRKKCPTNEQISLLTSTISFFIYDTVRFDIRNYRYDTGKRFPWQEQDSCTKEESQGFDKGDRTGFQTCLSLSLKQGAIKGHYYIYEHFLITSDTSNSKNAPIVPSLVNKAVGKKNFLPAAFK